MRAIGLLLAVLLVAGAFTGCLSGNDASEPTTEPSVETASSTAGEPVEGTESGNTSGPSPGAQPTWTHGDWWTYDVSFDLGFGELLAGESTLVLHDTQGSYKVASTDRNAAIIDQHFDTFFVGELDTDLNPVDQEGGFQMFAFPLEDGKTWTTEISTVNGTQELELTATATTVEDPSGSSDGFRIEGSSSNTTVTYTYAPDVQWITSYELVADDINGEQRTLVTVDLVDHGASYEGTFVVLEMEEVYVEFVFGVPLPGESFSPRVDTVTVPEGFTFVQRVVGLFGFDFVAPTSGAARVDVFSPEDEHESTQQTGEGTLLDSVIDEPPTPGEWRVSYENLGTNAVLVGFFGFDEQVVEFTAQDHAHHA